MMLIPIFTIINPRLAYLFYILFPASLTVRVFAFDVL